MVPAVVILDRFTRAPAHEKAPLVVRSPLRMAASIVAAATLAGAAAAGTLPAPTMVASDTGSWSMIPPPSGRHSHSAIHDPARDRIVVFGGDDGERRDDTWVIERSPGDAWARLHTTGTAPGPRFGHTAIHDPVRDRMLVFGTDDDDLQDAVWALALNGEPRWTQLAVTGALPEGLHQHSAIYDPLRDRMLVFGGLTTAEHAEVWALDLSGPPAWTLLVPVGSPPPARRQHTAIYDPMRDRMIVFGGANGVTALDDLWALDLSGTPAWTPLAPTGTPPAARFGHAAVHDPARDAMVMFGGSDGVSMPGDVWQLALGGAGEWTLLLPGGDPISPRYRHAAVLDPVRDELVVIGGSDPNNRNDVWALARSGVLEWRDLLTPGGPPRRSNPSVAFDPVANRMLVFGGYLGELRNDTRQLSFASAAPRWSGVSTNTPPAERSLHHAVYDGARHRMIVVGGTGYPTRNDAWALDLETEEWSVAAPGPGPGAEYFIESVAYDALRNDLIVHGPIFSSFSNELWRLDLDTGAWTKLTPGGDVPPYGEGVEMIYDPVRDRIVAVGPIDYDATASVVRELSLANPTSWTVVATAGPTPPGRFRHTLIYDPVRDRAVMFGGAPRAFLPDGRVWALALDGAPEWSELSEFPAAFFNHASFYEPLRDRMISFLGNETFALDWGTPLKPGVVCSDTVTTRPARVRGMRAATYRVVNPAATARAISYSVRSARDWPGFPLHGIVVVPGSSIGTVELDVPVPDSAAAGDAALVFTAAFTGAEGNDSSCTQRVDLVTATAAALIAAEYRDGAVRIAWETAAYEPLAIHRSRDGGAWTALGARWPDGRGRLEFEDRDVVAGSVYRYRLTRSGSLDPIAADAWVAVAALVRPMFHGVRPNPAPGAMALALELPRAATVEVRMFDVRGREVARQRTWLAAGAHSIPVRARAPLAPGVYLIRATCDGHRFEGRAIVVR